MQPAQPDPPQEPTRPAEAAQAAPTGAARSVLDSYRRLFAIPHVPGLLFWSLFARVHIGGLPIAVTFLVAGWTGSYALSGLVAGGLTVGTALAGPIRGRMSDLRAKDRLLTSSALCYGAGLAVLALLPGALWWVALPLALATGLFLPPANQIARAIWPRVTSGPTRQTMYAAEATLQELLFIVGPLLAAAVVGLTNGRVGVAVMAVLSVVGALGFAWSLRRAGLAAPESPEAGTGAPAGPRRTLLLDPRILLILLMSMLMVAGLGGVDLTSVAWSRELGTPGYAGALMAVYAAGSAVGGLLAGTFPGRPRLARRAFAAAAGPLLLVPLLPPVFHLPSPWLITPVLFVAGLGIAPTIAAVTERVGEIAPAHRRGEAYGWLSSAITGGISVAAPLTGWLIDLGGAAAGAAGSAALAVAAALVAPALRHGAAGGPAAADPPAALDAPAVPGVPAVPDAGADAPTPPRSAVGDPPTGAPPPAEPTGRAE
ncbi:MFS transporter [Streptomonospora nanhaiensis]|uniref:MFS family permease n=1 Tax=Streptomonospora nanhaiensis TaxID=1323731 RepID=A0A853BVD7_9ACTN|nr:MFS transporter [Streptomonospora nanhaiensis]NYI98461.1 MFS family permease [Streptomonospora nanhaiensis]